MMYQLVIDRYAQKQLGKIPPPHLNRIVKAINNFARDAHPRGYKKLTGRPAIEYELATIVLFIKLKRKFLAY